MSVRGQRRMGTSVGACDGAWQGKDKERVRERVRSMFLARTTSTANFRARSTAASHHNAL